MKINHCPECSVSKKHCFGMPIYRDNLLLLITGIKRFLYSSKTFQKSRKKGFSLLELSAMLLILGIAVPPMLAAFNYVMRSSATEEAITVSTFLAQDKMEEILNSDFFDMEGLDTKLVFQTYAAAGQPFEDYEFLIRTDYIDPATGVPPSTFTIISTRDVNGNITGERSNYLQLTVQVKNNKFPDKIITLQSLATPSADKRYYQ